ncbi:MAG: hypothetical protein WC813_03090 [Patescibacteria group bacterium]|jgi:hypothetical protein
MPEITKEQLDLIRTRCSWLLTAVRQGQVSPELALKGLEELIGAEALKARQTLPKNPYRISVKAAITQLRRMNKTLNLGFSEDEVIELEDTAPAWPDGKYMFRVMRPRLDTGDNKVLDTFNMHLACIDNVRGLSGVWKKKDLRRTDFKLSLAGGDATHTRGLSWAIINAHGRLRLTAENKIPPEAAADEALALAWQFPKYMTENAGLRHWLMGYQMSQRPFEESDLAAREPGNEEQQHFLAVSVGKVGQQIRLNNEWTYPGKREQYKALRSEAGQCFPVIAG